VKNFSAGSIVEVELVDKYLKHAESYKVISERKIFYRRPAGVFRFCDLSIKYYHLDGREMEAGTSKTGSAI